VAGLALDPGAQAQFERAVLDFERPGGKRLGRLPAADAQGEHARLARRRGEDDGAQPYRERGAELDLARHAAAAGSERGGLVGELLHASGSPLPSSRAA